MTAPAPLDFEPETNLMKGFPINLDIYEAPEVRTNKNFQGLDMRPFEQVYLPESMRPFMDVPPLTTKTLVEDDNRGAVATKPYMSIDGTGFYLSVKGIGSTVDPFSRNLLSKTSICSLLTDQELKDRIMASPGGKSPRYLTSELWQRYSPYGGQGIEHANYAMRAAEFDEVTSIKGFRVAPLVNIVYLPEELEAKVREIYWFSQFKGRMVQELRLVPSNVRVYFHGVTTIGGTVSSVFDLFEIDTNEKAMSFLRNFVKSGIPFLSLFSRSMEHNDEGTYSGFDFYDVWLDKDATVAPDGTLYWQDLEGLDWVTVPERDILEKVYHQVFRTLYEFRYAYQQIEMERCHRFGGLNDRKLQFELILREALKDDEFVDFTREGDALMMNIRNVLGESQFDGKVNVLDGGRWK